MNALKSITCLLLLKSWFALGETIIDVPSAPSLDPAPALPIPMDPKLYSPPMRVPDVGFSESFKESLNRPLDISPPKKVKPTLEEDEKTPCSYLWELSLGLNYTKIRTSGSYKNWQVDPTTQIIFSRKIDETPFMLGLRLFSVSGEGTIGNSTGTVGFAYFGPSVSYTSIQDRHQTSIDFGASFVKINGENLMGPQEPELSSRPGLKTDPPGLWWEMRYGKIIGGALGTGLTAGMQWGRKKTYYWAGLYTSAWH